MITTTKTNLQSKQLISGQIQQFKAIYNELVVYFSKSETEKNEEEKKLKN